MNAIKLNFQDDVNIYNYNCHILDGIKSFSITETKSDTIITDQLH